MTTKLWLLILKTPFVFLAYAQDFFIITRCNVCLLAKYGSVWVYCSKIYCLRFIILIWCSAAHNSSDFFSSSINLSESLDSCQSEVLVVDKCLTEASLKDMWILWEFFLLTKHVCLWPPPHHLMVTEHSLLRKTLTQDNAQRGKGSNIHDAHPGWWACTENTWLLSTCLPFNLMHFTCPEMQTNLRPDRGLGEHMALWELICHHTEVSLCKYWFSCLNGNQGHLIPVKWEMF